MSRHSRRRLLAGAGALAATAALGCGAGSLSGGAGAGSGGVGDVPEPPPPPLPTEGTLFLPDFSGSVPEAFAASPEWFRRAPGIYLPTVTSSGGSSLVFADRDTWRLPNLIRHFDELPRFLDEAHQLGTNVIYLVDIYEGEPGAPEVDAWTWKAAYQPRASMGGAEALKRAIATIHARGGKVILYFSGFALNQKTPLAQAKGEKWSVIGEDGKPIDQPYEGYWMPCPNAPGWRRHLVDVAERYARDYGADGVHIDSFGNQRGWKCHSTSHGHEPGEGIAYNEGCTVLCEQVRAAMRKHVPEAVVIVEAPKILRMFRAIDGAQDWGIHDLSKRWAWDHAGKTNLFVTAWSLDDLHQVLALGHKWVLTPQFLAAPDRPTCSDWLSHHYPKIKGAKTEKSRRFWAERHYRGLHAYRNSGQLQGLAVPALDDLTHRRWLGEEHFASREAFDAHIATLRERAAAVDAALDGATPMAITAHVRHLMGARRRLSPILDDGGRVELVGERGTVAGYRWSSRQGTVYAVVNVGSEGRAVPIPTKRRLRDAVTGEPTIADAVVPPHTLRLLQEV